MDKPCMCQLNLHLLDLTNTKPIIRKKDGLVNSLEEKVLGLTEKGTIFKKKLYSHTVLKANQNEDANEVPYLSKKSV